jgi:hypothetical protein
VWNQHQHKTMLDIGWKQSKTDEFLYYKGNAVAGMMEY